MQKLMVHLHVVLSVATFAICSNRIVLLFFVSKPLSLSLDLGDFTHVSPFDSKNTIDPLCRLFSEQWHLQNLPQLSLFMQSLH